MICEGPFPSEKLYFTYQLGYAFLSTVKLRPLLLDEKPRWEQLVCTLHLSWLDFLLSPAPEHHFISFTGTDRLRCFFEWLRNWCGRSNLVLWTKWNHILLSCLLWDSRKNKDLCSQSLQGAFRYLLWLWFLSITSHLSHCHGKTTVFFLYWVCFFFIKVNIITWYLLGSHKEVMQMMVLTTPELPGRMVCSWIRNFLICEESNGPGVMRLWV